MILCSIFYIFMDRTINYFNVICIWLGKIFSKITLISSACMKPYSCARFLWIHIHMYGFMVVQRIKISRNDCVYLICVSIKQWVNSLIIWQKIICHISECTPIYNYISLRFCTMSCNIFNFDLIKKKIVLDKYWKIKKILKAENINTVHERPIN